jgi:hypothetical protein
VREPIANMGEYQKDASLASKTMKSNRKSLDDGKTMIRRTKTKLTEEKHG